MSTLERALQIAAEVHSGQIDDAGEPRILHSVRVMQAMDDTDARIVAVLHEVMEGTEWTPERLRFSGFSDVVASAVGALSRRGDEAYADFIARAGAHPVARQVKRADLVDNLSRAHRAPFGERADERVVRQVRALALLDATTPEG